jgi:DNA-binding beta-propeller fold protein YncE
MIKTINLKLIKTANSSMRWSRASAGRCGLVGLAAAILAAAVMGSTSGLADAAPAKASISYDGYVGAGSVLPLSSAAGKIGNPIPAPGATWIFADPSGKLVYADDWDPGATAVTSISTATNDVLATITLPSQAGKIAFTPDGKTAYVIDRTVPYGLTPVTTATGKAGPRIAVGDDPQNLVISPDGGTVYVSSAVSQAVIPVTTRTNKPGKPIALASQPDALALSANGATLYVSEFASPSVDGVVQVISTASRKIVATIPAGLEPSNLAITPNGKTLYASNYYSGTVTPISTGTNKAGKPITVCETAGFMCQPWTIAITPNGATAYVANAGEGSTIAAINVAKGTAGEITIAATPVVIGLAPGGATLYVGVQGGGNALYPVTVKTGKVGTPIMIGGGPSGIAFLPPPLSVATHSLKPGTVGRRYSATLAASGGTGTFEWSLASGALPKGLRLSASGVISGKPKVKGKKSFVVRATDPAGASAQAHLTIVIT